MSPLTYYLVVLAHLARDLPLLHLPDHVYCISCACLYYTVKDDYSNILTFISGPGLFQDIVSSTSGRTPVRIAKPSEFLKKTVLEQLRISNPQRSLFVGDM